MRRLLHASTLANPSVRNDGKGGTCSEKKESLFVTEIICYFEKSLSFSKVSVYKIIIERTTLRRGTIKDIILRKSVRWIRTKMKNKNGECLFKTPNSKI